ncbi:hypothetical protein MTR67_031191, partial [Solanum verrucosum]
SRGGKKYFITFIDNCTRYCQVYLLNSRNEEIETLTQYKTEVKYQFDRKKREIKSDRCGDYESPFVEICFEIKLNYPSKGKISLQKK